MSRKTHEDKVKRSRRNKAIRKAVHAAVQTAKSKAKEELAAKRRKSDPAVMIQDFFMSVADLREAEQRLTNSLDVAKKAMETLKKGSNSKLFENVDIKAFDNFYSSMDKFKSYMDSLNKASAAILDCEKMSDKFLIVTTQTDALNKATAIAVSIGSSIDELVEGSRAVLKGKITSDKLTLTCEDSYLDFGDEKMSDNNTNEDAEVIVSEEQEAEVLAQLGIDTKSESTDETDQAKTNV